MKIPVPMACVMIAAVVIPSTVGAAQDGIQVRGMAGGKRVLATVVQEEVVEVKLEVIVVPGVVVQADITEAVEAAAEISADVAAQGEAQAESQPATMQDCNGNGIDDADDILFGVSTDFDADGHPDECEAALGDINLDGTVTQLDVNAVLGWWGLGYSPTSDANGDGTVDGFDLSLVLAAFGSNPG